MLTPEQQEAVRTFREISGLGEEASAQHLANNNFDVDMAINNYLSGMDSGGGNGSGGSGSSGIAQRRSGGSTPSSQRGGGDGSSQRGGGEADELIPSRNPMMDSLLHPLRWLFTSRPQFHNPDADARRFVADFESSYSEVHPRFWHRSYATAVRAAFQQGKFLLVYLHSAMHDDTADFCRHTLCKESVARSCDASMVTWAGSIESVEGYSLSLQLQAQTFPFLALLVCKSEREVVIADRVQGRVSEDGLLERLRNIQLVFQSQVQQIQQEQHRRAESASLIEEQDREFRESERADLLRQERREQEEEARRRAAQEEAARKGEEERAEAQAEAEAAAAIERKRKTVRPEPPAGGADVATLRFQMPSGDKVVRRFHKDASVGELCGWLDVHFSDSTTMDTVNYTVSTGYPKVDLTDMQATLEGCGLHPRGMLYVHDRDL